MADIDVSRYTRKLIDAIESIPYGYEDQVFERAGIVRIDVAEEDITNITLADMKEMRMKALVSGLRKGSVSAIKAFNEYEEAMEGVKAMSDMVINIVPYRVPDKIPDWMRDIINR